jgi:hypothetical protein
MRVVGCLLFLPTLLPLACASGASQTGPIGGCDGITLSGPGAFTPLSGMTYQNAVNLGGGEAAPGTYEVVIWGATGDAGNPTGSYDFICRELTAGAFLSSTLYVPPQTLELNLPDGVTNTSYRATAVELTEPYSQTSAILEDIAGEVGISSVGTLCLTGSFSAKLVPVDPATGFAIDGGAGSMLEGTFSLPFCG